MERNLDIIITSGVHNGDVRITVGKANGMLNLITGEGRVSERVPCKCSRDKQAKLITEFVVRPETLKRINAELVS
jgi:hypothetical protein